MVVLVYFSFKLFMEIKYALSSSKHKNMMKADIAVLESGGLQIDNGMLTREYYRWLFKYTHLLSF